MVSKIPHMNLNLYNDTVLTPIHSTPTQCKPILDATDKDLCLFSLTNDETKTSETPYKFQESLQQIVSEKVK